MPERAPRLALCRTPHWDKAQPEGKAVLEDAANRLRAAGAEVVEAELPNSCAHVSDIQNRHSYFEAPRNHAPERYRHEALLSLALREGRIAGGQKLDLGRFPRRLACGRHHARGREPVGRRLRRDPDSAGAGPGAQAPWPRPAMRSSTGCGPCSTCRA